MKITIELNGVKLSRNMPTSWHEVTFGQFLKLQSIEKDTAKIFALFLDIEEAIVVKAKIHDLDGILLKLRFLNDQVPLSVPLEIMGYPIPKDLGLDCLGPFVDMQKDVKEGAGRTDMEKLERYTTYVAMYACRPYDWQKAEEMAPMFLNAPAPEVLAIGHFTLLRLIGSASSTKTGSLNLTTRLRRFKQALKIWARNMGTMARFYTWRLKQAKAGKQS